MALLTFYNKGDANAIPINADNLNFNFQEILNLIYPIGRGFIDFTDTDYSNYLGMTFERELIGMVGVGYNPDDSDFSTIGSTGGEKTHTLTISEMPKHTHNINLSASTSTGTSKLINSSWSWDTKNQENANMINSAGGGQAHNNLQPYKVVSYWKRIA